MELKHMAEGDETQILASITPVEMVMAYKAMGPVRAEAVGALMAGIRDSHKLMAIAMIFEELEILDTIEKDLGPELMPECIKQVLFARDLVQKLGVTGWGRERGSCKNGNRGRDDISTELDEDGHGEGK